MDKEIDSLFLLADNGSQIAGVSTTSFALLRGRERGFGEVF
jgi:hypothetical protein